MLLTNICLVDTGKLLTDHVWVHKSCRLSNLGKFKRGENLEFSARVCTYNRRKDCVDYSLGSIRGIKKVGKINTMFLTPSNEKSLEMAEKLNWSEEFSFSGWRNIKKLGSTRLKAFACLAQLS